MDINFFLIVNTLILISLIIIGLLGFKYYSIFKKEKLLEEQRKKNEEEKFSEFKKEMTSKFESVATSYNSFSNKITKDITDSFTRYEENVKNFNEKVQKMEQSQENLTKIFSNVKKFGTAAEFSLASLLKDLLSPSQYIPNARIKPDTTGTVEFAIRLPKDVLVAVDSFFPVSQLEKIKDADELKDKKLSADARRKLASAIDTKASSINELYIDPPKTAPFGVVYLPTESLFFEACNYRDPKTKEPLIHTLYREYNINILGPTTLSVFLQTLHWGYESVQISQKSKKIYDDLQNLKFNFVNHMKLIEEIYRNANLTMKKIDEAGKSGRSITNVLANIEEPDTIEINPETNPKNLKVLK